MKAFFCIILVSIIGALIVFSCGSEAAKLQIIFSPFYGVSFGVALVCLVCASLKNCSLSARITLWFLGLLFLLAQGVCWGSSNCLR